MFSWNWNIRFLLWHGARNRYEVVLDRAGIFRKNFFCSKIWGNGLKIGFLEFKEKFGDQFSLNLFYNENLSENYSLCFCIDPILGKILFLRYRSKCFCESDCRIFKSTISPEQIDESTSLFAC